MSAIPLDEQALNALIEQQNWWFSPAYAHGILSALVACDEAARYGEFLFFEQEPNEWARQVFPKMAEQIEASLRLETLNFQLLLPRDVKLGWRAEALADWALAVSRVFEVLQPPVEDEALEFTQDIFNIAELNPDVVDHGHNQRQLMELEEYCRVGIVLVFEAMRGA